MKLVVAFVICQFLLCGVVVRAWVQSRPHFLARQRINTANRLHSSNDDHVAPDNFVGSSSTISVPSPTIASQESAVVLEKARAPISFEPSGTKFCLCSDCKTAYVIPKKLLSGKGRVVKCNICGKEWFQGNDRLYTVDDSNGLTELSEVKQEEIKRILADKNFPRHPRTDRAEVFVGNLPYTYQEKDILDLFAEYGIVGVSMAKDQQQQSKGFAFLEFAFLEDAELAVSKMNGFWIDNDRKLSVRSALGYVKGSKGKGGAGNGSSNNSKGPSGQGGSGGQQGNSGPVWERKAVTASSA